MALRQIDTFEPINHSTRTRIIYNTSLQSWNRITKNTTSGTLQKNFKFDQIFWKYG